ncbi:hypothetical protein FA95DRAFT_1484724 [Auriscalpium vulgare]|uniref:Uncharacterized protein n=1 Tax=Auriscalpium vulgare TaxID=40419 RepID=A0ACB8S6L6_9AGAM|nr:hypothetical protein FA95DRAFT_1484724 [Auriscalpium vulgare]
MGEDRPPASSSNPSLAKPSHSVRSKLAPAATIRTVVTAPPWAKDEPPSPTEDFLPPPPSTADSRPPSEARRSDVMSYQSSNNPADGEHRWFPFTRRRPTILSIATELGPSQSDVEQRQSTSRPSFGSASAPRVADAMDHNFLKDKDSVASHRKIRDWGLQLTLPTPPPAPFTLSQSRTPGWDSPWAAPKPSEMLARGMMYEKLRAGEGSDMPPDTGNTLDQSRWVRARKRARAYLLTNTYVPLLFRFINITFTTAALAMAVRIRNTEKRNGVMGALGSSPTLIVIFAPPTLVHVMAAVYLEYFGRPLGLWRTSGKLAVTLLEVLFICAWSAALSLCFDNFFTSLIPCASASQISWYSQLPRPQSPFNNIDRSDGGPGESLCDDQLALICLTGVGLLMYCFNLVISLFRIFEKVKYHHAPSWGRSSRV